MASARQFHGIFALRFHFCFIFNLLCHLVQESFGILLVGGLSRLANLPQFVQNDVSIVSLVFGGSKRLCVFNIQKKATNICEPNER